MEDGARFTAKDANELAGLSYRQLNDWDARGAISAQRAVRGGWRKFTPKQLFAMMVCNEIRRLYGTPVENLQFVLSCMTQEGADHLTAAVLLMKQGLHVFMLTDLTESFVMDSDLVFTDYMRYGYFRTEETRPYIFLRLNEVVNRLVGAMDEAEQLKPHDGMYRVIAEVAAVSAVRTVPEMDLLQAVRSGKFDRITVDARNGLIRFLNAEGDAASEDIGIEGDTVNVKRRAEFETVSITARDGVVVRVRRELPKKYSEQDNEPILFAPIVRAERAQLKRNRDGEQPNASANIKNQARRDRKSLSREKQGAPPTRTRASDAQSRKMP